MYDILRSWDCVMCTYLSVTTFIQHTAHAMNEGSFSRNDDCVGSLSIMYMYFPWNNTYLAISSKILLRTIYFIQTGSSALSNTYTIYIILYNYGFEM